MPQEVLAIEELEGKYVPKAVIFEGRGFFLQRMEERSRNFLRENIWKLGSQQSKIAIMYCFLLEMEEKKIVIQKNMIVKYFALREAANFLTFS
jgi:hypothetical protein